MHRNTFDYEDMKVAMVVQEFFNFNQIIMIAKGYEDFEDLIALCVEIRKAWEDLEQEDCSEVEYAYVQYFAERYLHDKFFGDKL